MVRDFLSTPSNPDDHENPQFPKSGRKPPIFTRREIVTLTHQAILMLQFPIEFPVLVPEGIAGRPPKIPTNRQSTLRLHGEGTGKQTR